MIPAPLLRSCRVHFAEGRPDAEVSIGHGEPQECKPTVLEIAQELEPTLLALPLAALTGQDGLVAVDESPTIVSSALLRSSMPAFRSCCSWA